MLDSIASVLEDSSDSINVANFGSAADSIFIARIINSEGIFSSIGDLS